MTKNELEYFAIKVKTLWEEGKIKSPVHLAGGNEEQLIKIFKKIKRNDYVLCTHRNMYHALLHGIDPDVLLSEILKEPSSPSHGRAGSMCINSPEHNFYSSPIIGGNCAIAVGIAWAIKESRDTRTHVWCFIGDCVVETGHFYESMIYAMGWKLPITFIIEDNNRATCTPNEARMGYNYVRENFKDGLNEDYIRYYEYEPKWPHVGSGKYVAF